MKKRGGGGGGGYREWVAKGMEKGQIVASLFLPAKK